MLHLWPEDLKARAAGAFSEDVMEHFFFSEQLYILCQVNWVLKAGGTYRVSMPDLDKLLSFISNCHSGPDEFLHRLLGWIRGRTR